MKRRYKVHTVWLTEADNLQNLMEEISQVESELGIAESTYEEIKENEKMCKL